MRVLVLPTISKRRDVSLESCMIVFHTWARNMPEHFWYIVLGKGADLKQMMQPNVQYMTLEDNIEYNSQHTSFPSEVTNYFHRSYGKFPIDLIFTTRVPIGAMIKKKFMAVRSGAKVPVFLYITKSLGAGETPDIVFDTDIKLRGISYSECPTMFLTQHERNVALRSMQPYFSGTTILEAEKHSRVFSQGMDVNRIEKAIEGVKKRGRFTYYFGGRFVSNKRWKECLTFLREMRMADGNATDIEVTTPASGGSKDDTEFQSININYGLPIEDLWKLQAQCHIAICKSEAEGLPIGFIEQIFCGLILVCYRRSWSEAAFGKSYPFFFNNDDEARALFRWIKKNYDQAVKMMAPVRQQMKDVYSVENTRKVFEEWFHTETKGTYYDKLITTDFQIVLDSLPNKFSFGSFINRLCELKPGYGMGLKQEYVGNGTADLGTRDVYHWLTKNAKDLNNAADPIFQKL